MRANTITLAAVALAIGMSMPGAADARVISICERLSGGMLFGFTLPCPIHDSKRLAEEISKHSQALQKLTNLTTQANSWLDTLKSLNGGIGGITSFAMSLFGSGSISFEGIPLIKDDAGIQIPGASGTGGLSSLSDSISRLFMQPGADSTKANDVARQIFTQALATAAAGRQNTEQTPEKLNKLGKQVDAAQTVRDHAQAGNALRIALLQSIANSTTVESRMVSSTAAFHLQKSRDDHDTDASAWTGTSPYAMAADSAQTLPDEKTEASAASVLLTETRTEIEYSLLLYNYLTDINTGNATGASLKEERIGRDYPELTSRYRISTGDHKGMASAILSIIETSGQNLRLINERSEKNEYIVSNESIRDEYANQVSKINALDAAIRSDEPYSSYIP